jgi:hypothetical protein
VPCEYAPNLVDYFLREDCDLSFYANAGETMRGM